MTVDLEADAAYVELSGEDSQEVAVRQVVAFTAEGQYEVVLDFSSSGKLLGVEILGAKAALLFSFVKALAPDPD